MATVTTRGERIQGQNISAAATGATDFSLYAQSLRGADITAGSIISPAGPQEYFQVTGATTTINFFSTANLVDGKEIVLYLNANQTFAHNAGGAPGGTVAFSLQNGVNASGLSGQTIVLRYDATLVRMKQIGGNVGAGTGVASVSAGTGISITGTGTNPVVNNTGVLVVTAGTGISVTGTAQNPIINNTGVLSVTAGSGISITGSGSNPVITNTGVLSLSAGAGISLSFFGGTFTVRNRLIGSLQLGGLIPSMGSTTIWFYGGNAFGPTPMEYPIESFMAAGAAFCTLRGKIFDYVGPDAVVVVTVNGGVVGGSAHGIGVSSIGGTVILSPLTIPAGSNRSMGLAITPSASSGCIYAATLDFFG